MNKIALIFGVNSQDGSYLADYLFSKNYEIFGTSRNINKLEKKWLISTKVKLIECEDFKKDNVLKIIKKVNPHEVYNYIGVTSGEGMYDQPIESSYINGNFVLVILECIKEINKKIKFCNSSSREIFGIQNHNKFDENTKYHPRSPYGASKAFATDMIRIYREHYNLFCNSAILFNHESPRRGFNFVTRKISSSVAKIKLKKIDKLKLGSLDQSRDWGFAGDYVRAMWMMLQTDEPDDYIIASGYSHTVREFCEEAFKIFNLDYRDFVVIDESIKLRESQNIQIIGDNRKAMEKLGWKPEINFKELVKMMVESDYSLEK